MMDGQLTDDFFSCFAQKIDFRGIILIDHV
jgi:hypothetical protein